jgi:hypothetical protein
LPARAAPRGARFLTEDPDPRDDLLGASRARAA